MAENEKNEEKYTKRNKLQIRFYPHEIEEIRKRAQIEKISPSDLGRNAVKDYMKRAQNPEIYAQLNTDNQNNANSLKIEEIENKMSLLIKQIEKLTQLNSQILNNQMNFPSKLEEDPELEQHINAITEAILENRQSTNYKISKTPLTIEDIVEKTNLDVEIIFDILTNTEKYKPIKKGWDMK